MRVYTGLTHCDSSISIMSIDPLQPFPLQPFQRGQHEDRPHSVCHAARIKRHCMPKLIRLPFNSSRPKTSVHHANKIHYDGAKNEEVIIQVSGMGPATSTPAEKK